MATKVDLASRVEQLLAQHGSYRPVDLLVSLRRLSEAALDQWRSAPATSPVVLEEQISGAPERWVELLREAADWAERLGLEREIRIPQGADGVRLKASRSPYRQQLLCAEYRRRESGPQLNLFLDNPAMIARNQLSEALLAEDAVAAGERLSRLAAAGVDHSTQTAAEVLIDALGWQLPDDPARALTLIEQQLSPAAEQFFGHRAQPFLRRYWRRLMSKLPAAEYDPEQPRHHPSWAAMRAANWGAVIETIQTVPDYWRHVELLTRMADAAIALEHPSSLMQAVIELCWCDEAIAEQWLNRCTHASVEAALDTFCNSDSEPQWSLFPAWLALSVTVPQPDSLQTAPPSPAQQAFIAARELRPQRDNLDKRQQLQQHAPGLLQLWLTHHR
ncbi:MAG: hypothetical protein Tsb002_32160 [Wenzhouxiangellaceae bacterium]